MGRRETHNDLSDAVSMRPVPLPHLRESVARSTCFPAWNAHSSPPPIPTERVPPDFYPPSLFESPPLFAETLFTSASPGKVAKVGPAAPSP